MPGIDKLIDQERPVRLLTDILESGNLPHAFLFTGTAGVGKSAAALMLAMTCNCENRHVRHPTVTTDVVLAKTNDAFYPCGTCRSCRKILGGSHPDIHRLKPAGAAIKVDSVRDLCRKLILKPNEAQIRAAIIADAHTLNAEAGNTLLKIIEEPPDRTIFLLIADSDSNLLPTIVSRCRHIRFNPISRDRLQDHLIKYEGLATPHASVIAAMAQGSMARAKRLIETDWIDQRDQILKAVRCFSSGRIRPGLVFSEALSKNRDQLTNALDVMKIWFRDIAVCGDAPDRVINRDLIVVLRQAASRTSLDAVVRKLEAISIAESDLQANANPRLTMDRLVMAIAARN